MMSGLPPQFNIPVHPSCVPLNEHTKALGRTKVAECRYLLNRFGQCKKARLAAGIQAADERVANGGTASEYIAYLKNLKRKQDNDYE